MSSSIDIPGKLRAQHPHLSDISESVGGTIYATTPGGTKIVYRREELVHLSKSPLAKSRPLNMPELPGVTTTTSSTINTVATAAASASVVDSSLSGSPARVSGKEDGKDESHTVFEMDHDV